MSVIVTGPGVYDIPEDVYHRDDSLASELGRSLSQSGAKVLLECPARFVYERDHGRPPKEEYDVGHLAHRLTLGTGARIRVVDAYDWQTRAAQAARKAAREAGETPVHRGTLLAGSRMARAVRRHPAASAILSAGRPEVSFYWIDPDTGVTCRGRADWLRDNGIADLKFLVDASPTGFAKAAAAYGWDMQAAYYTDGLYALTGQWLPFLFIAVEKTRPHLVGVYRLDDEAMESGRARNRAALRQYAEYESLDWWPGYGDDITDVSLPRWRTRPYLEVTL